MEGDWGPRNPGKPLAGLSPEGTVDQKAAAQKNKIKYFYFIKFFSFRDKK